MTPEEMLKYATRFTLPSSEDNMWGVNVVKMEYVEREIWIIQRDSHDVWSKTHNRFIQLLGYTLICEIEFKRDEAIEFVKNNDLIALHERNNERVL